MCSYDFMMDRMYMEEMEDDLIDRMEIQKMQQKKSVKPPIKEEEDLEDTV